MAANGGSIWAFNRVLIESQSLSSSFVSPSFETTDIKTVFIQASWDSGSSLTGNMFLQASADNVIFTDIAGTNLAVVGTSGSNGWNVQDTGYTYMRFRYSSTTGTGNIKLIIVGKYI